MSIDSASSTASDEGVAASFRPTTAFAEVLPPPWL